MIYQFLFCCRLQCVMSVQTTKVFLTVVGHLLIRLLYATLNKARECVTISDLFVFLLSNIFSVLH